MPQKPKEHRYKSTSDRHDLRENGVERAEEERRAHGRRDTEVEVALCLPLATYANAGKSIYLYLFIAFKCFPRNGAERARTSSVVGADHPRKRADPARCGLRDPWGPSSSPSLRLIQIAGGCWTWVWAIRSTHHQSIRNFMMQISERDRG